MKKHTVFLEIASDDDPPWMTYRYVKAKTREQAIASAIALFQEDQELGSEDMVTGWRVFRGFIQEVEE